MPLGRAHWWGPANLLSSCLKRNFCTAGTRKARLGCSWTQQVCTVLVTVPTGYLEAAQLSRKWKWSHKNHLIQYFDRNFSTRNTAQTTDVLSVGLGISYPWVGTTGMRTHFRYPYRKKWVLCSCVIGIHIDRYPLSLPPMFWAAGWHWMQTRLQMEVQGSKSRSGARGVGVCASVHAHSSTGGVL